MPLGTREPVNVSTPTPGGEPASLRFGHAPTFRPSSPLDFAPSDLWRHHTITAAQLASGAVVRIASGATFTRTRVMVREEVGLIVGHDRAADQLTDAPNGYELRHPGQGQLDERHPGAETLTLKVADGSSDPTLAVDVWLLDGIYAEEA